MNGLRRKTDRIRILTFLSALTLCGFGRLAVAGPAGYVGTYAGGGGPKDGNVAVSVSLSDIINVKIDGNGSIYFSTDRQIWKLNADRTLTLVAGAPETGYSGDGGPATSAQLNDPSGIAFDKNGDLYFADANNCRIRKIDHLTGVISTIAGTGTCGYNGFNDGSATSVALDYPQSLAFDNEGNLIIVDTSNWHLRKLVFTTGILSTINKNTNQFNQLNNPTDVVIDAEGNMIVADCYHHQIRKIDHVTFIVSVIAGTGVAGYSGDNGPATSAELNYPSNVTLDNLGNLYVVDSRNQRIRKIDIKTGIITTVAGTGATGYSGDEGDAISAKLNLNPNYFPSMSNGITIASNGDLFFADGDNFSLRKVMAVNGVITDSSCKENCSKIITVAGNGYDNYSGDGGLATSAQMTPGRMAFDAKGDLYLSDIFTIRKVDRSTGIITTVAGTGEAGFSGDGGPATSAQINYAGGLALDKNGDLYISDYENNRIRKVDISTGIITTIAGGGEDAGDGGPAISAKLNGPGALAFDSGGNLIFQDRIDYGSPNICGIRKIMAIEGIITDASPIFTSIGTQGHFNVGNIPATLYYYLFEVRDMTFDNDGNLYIDDSYFNQILKYDPISGNISTVAGQGNDLYHGNYGGDGGDAKSAVFDGPVSIAFDTDYNLFIADANNNRIRRIDHATGIINAFAGTGSPACSEDGGSALASSIIPHMLRFDAEGNLYFTEYCNNRIRVIYQAGADRKSPSLSAGYGASYVNADGASYAGYGHPYFRLVMQDNGSGFGDFSISKATNVLSPLVQEKISDSSFVPGFTGGTTNPVHAYLVADDPASPSSVALSLSDEAGNRIALFVGFFPKGSTQPSSIAFTGVDKSQGKLSILASDHGLRNVIVTANGTATTIGDVSGGAVKVIDLRSQLRDGDDNEIAISAEGYYGAGVLASSETPTRIDAETSGKVYGDVNFDGSVTIGDVTLLLKFYLGLAAPDAAQSDLGDVRPKASVEGGPFGDGRIGADDLNAVLRAVVGLESIL